MLGRDAREYVSALDRHGELGVGEAGELGACEPVLILVEQAEVAAYFGSRPRESQLGAWASPQSQVVQSREELDARLADAERRFPEGVEVPVPSGWGGYRVNPSTWEFWAGRAGRLHDRLRYRRTPGSAPSGPTGPGWLIDRLAP